MGRRPVRLPLLYAEPKGFILTITPAEAVLVTSVAVHPRDFSGTWLTNRSYGPPLAMAAGVEYVCPDGFCHTTNYCQYYGCGNCGSWTNGTWGQRPAPGAGSFCYKCYGRYEPGDASCN